MLFMSMFIVFLIIFFISSVKIVNQMEEYVIERLGKYNRTLQPGIHILIPFIDRVACKVSLKESVYDFEPQSVITQDNVTMQIDTIVYAQVVDSNKYVYGIDNATVALDSLTSTTLRNLVGELNLDQTLTSRDVINGKLCTILDEATDKWGIKVNRVEVKNIIPPKDIRDSMEKQMKAERERREAILRAEGTKKSAVLMAEGEKEAAILSAQAEKETALLAAQAEKEATILKAQGEADAISLKAEAEAKAIEKTRNAQADAFEYLANKSLNDEVVKLQSLQTLEKVADGQATKLIIPSEIQNLTSLVSAADATIDKNRPQNLYSD